MYLRLMCFGTGSKWGDGKPAAGKQAITIDDIEAEKARFRAEWAHEKARGGSDSQADQTEQGDLLMEGDKPQLQQVKQEPVPSPYRMLR